MLQPVKTKISLNNTAPRAVKTSVKLTAADTIDAVKLRLGIGRKNASITCGLYYVGNPVKNSPILVTSNYRLTFDAVRRELDGLDVWILVIDTGGINVWCSAGKGSFCAEAVIKGIKTSNLSYFAPEGTLILPQLSASGVNITSVRKASKYSAVFGPVYARDIKEFIQSGMKKTDSMKTVSFTLKERAVLIPVELVHAWKFAAAFIFLAGMLALPLDTGFIHRYVLTAGFLGVSILTGTVLVPLLLPFIPGRFFSVKGLFLNSLWAVLFYVSSRSFYSDNITVFISVVLMGTAAASYAAMNFTGCSTFTNQKGTEREVQRSLPIQLIAASAGLAAAVIHALLVFIK